MQRLKVATEKQTSDNSPKNAMTVSVVLCTWNRSASLARALSSIANSVFSAPLKWEVVVVDNNSNDRTRDVVSAFRAEYGDKLRYVFESRPGLSNARNAGIREAQGEILAFVDDDVTVEPAWLDNLTSPLRSGEWAGSGGRILPAHNFAPPRWFSFENKLLVPLCAYYNAGDVLSEATEPPYGANMAFRRAMFGKHGGFRTDLGRTLTNLLSNEDTEFGRRLIAVGERLCYVPSATVYHEIHESRLHKGYYLRWWFDYGRAVSREKGKGEPVWGISRNYVRIPKMILTVLPSAAFRWLATFNRKERFLWKCAVWRIAGQIVESYRVAVEPHPTDDRVPQANSREA